jgi:hypothetical protein
MQVVVTSWKESTMNLHAEEQAAGVQQASLERQIREFVGKDNGSGRRFVAEASQSAATKVNSLVQRVAGSSLQEIDETIVELQKLRVHIVGEGERLQRALASYGELVQATQRSTKIIAESLRGWNGTADAGSH